MKYAGFTTRLQEQGIIGGMVRNNFGIENGKLIVSGDVGNSFLHRRMAATGAPEQMPPVTRNLHVKETLDLI